MRMITINPAETPTPDLHQYLIGSVSPRPIAFVSSLSADGIPNLAPYSFFNAFSSRPPIVIFSANRRVRDNTTKDTLSNAKATGEVVINMVSYEIARQAALASVEYAPGVSEFEKSGLTPIPSELVKPFRVKESPVQMECKVREILPLGEEGGAGNLVICEVLRMHIMEDVIDERGRIDPHKIDLVGRMGRAFYCRASGEAVFPIVQPFNQMGIGVHQLPPSIRHSSILTGWNLAQLASVEAIPDSDKVDEARKDPRVMDALAGNTQDRERHLHAYAKELLEKEEIERAWTVLLAE